MSCISIVQTYSAASVDSPHKNKTCDQFGLLLPPGRSEKGGRRGGIKMEEVKEETGERDSRERRRRRRVSERE